MRYTHPASSHHILPHAVSCAHCDEAFITRQSPLRLELGILQTGDVLPVLTLVSGVDRGVLDVVLLW